MNNFNNNGPYNPYNQNKPNPQAMPQGQVPPNGNVPSGPFAPGTGGVFKAGAQPPSPMPQNGAMPPNMFRQGMPPTQTPQSTVPMRQPMAGQQNPSMPTPYTAGAPVQNQTFRAGNQAAPGSGGMFSANELKQLESLASDPKLGVAIPANNQNLDDILGTLGVNGTQKPPNTTNPNNLGQTGVAPNQNETQPLDDGATPTEQNKRPEPFGKKLESDLNEKFPSLASRVPPPAQNSRARAKIAAGSGDDGSSGTNGDKKASGSKGSNGNSSGKKKKKKRGKKTKLRIAMEILLGFVCLGIIAGCGVAVAIASYVSNATADDGDMLDLNAVKLTYSTIFMAYDETVGDYVEYQRIYDGQNRRWIELGDMPDHLIDVIIASEDHGFFEHQGVDWIRTIAATLNAYTPLDLLPTRQGGSTLTQQLIKNITTENEASGIEGALRKLREIFRALVMEQEFSKDQILESYLNTISLSGTVAGIEAGANHYFNKTTEELTVAECAAIVVITKAPVAYSPFGNPESNKDQRDWVITQMYEELGSLTKAEYDAAMAESDAMTFPEEGYTNSGEDIYTFFTDVAIKEIIEDFQLYKGMTAEEANDYLYTGGLTVYLTIDHDIQQAVDDAVIDADGDILWEGHNPEDATEPVEGSIVVLDYQGQLKGIAGSILPKEESLAFNYATEALKQPGSTMKPLAPYAPAIDTDKIHYSTVFVDSPISNLESNSKEEPNWPSNWGGVWTNQLITVVRAIEVSLNTTAAASMDLIGSSFAFDYLTTRMGLTLNESYFPNNDRNAGGALGLGMLQDGTNLYDMTAAYMVFGNGGQFYEPHSYTRIVDNRGDVVLDMTQQIQPIQALQPDSAMVMNKLLESVMDRGTGSRWNNAAFDHPNGLSHAGKSGTADDGAGNATDLWYIGMDPYYITGVWVGHKTKVPIEEKTGNGYSANRSAWKYVMERITEELPYKDFPVDETVVSRQYCKVSGDLATTGCVTGETNGWYKASNIPPVCTATDHNPEFIYGYTPPEA